MHQTSVIVCREIIYDKSGNPARTKLSIMTKTNEQLTKAIDAKLEILKITMKQSVTAIEKKNISSAIVLHVEKES